VVATLVRLKLSLLRNALRRSVWRTVGLILGLVYALGVVVLAFAGLVALRWTSVELTADVTVLAFTALTAGWLLLSLLVFGIDETLDPARFALLPLRAREIMPGLLISGLVGSTGLATVLVSIGLVASWSRGPGPLGGTLVAIPVGVATCFLLSRAATAAFSAVLSSRRFRDFAFVGLAVLGMAFGIAANLVGGVVDTDLAGLRQLLADAAQVAGWTPFGWIWALPADVARGDWLVAGLRLLLALAFVAVLWRGWEYYLDRRLTEPLEAPQAGGRVRNGGFVDRLYPSTPAGGVAARTLRYWRRDPRYVAGIAGFLIGPGILMVAQLANPVGEPLVAVFAPTLLCWLLGASLAQDISYDGSAIWLHASSGLRGVDDRIGRVLSTATVFLPVLVLLTLAGLALTGQWSVWLPVVAVSVNLALVSIGVGAFVGTLWQWPAPPPGANPFQKGASGGLPSMAAFGVTSAASLVLAVPTIGLVIASFWFGWLAWLGLVVGLGVGAVTLWQGIVRGGAVLDRRWPDVLAATSQR
jgi:ABC-2 type transport system permease protein